MSFRPSLILLLLGVAGAGLLPGGRAEAKYTAELNADTLVLTGNGQGDTLAVRLTPGDPTHLDIDVGNDAMVDFSFDRSLFTAISISAGSGRDTILIDESFGTFTDEKLTIDGGGGNDTITGGSGDDTIDGGGGADIIAAGGGNDSVTYRGTEASIDGGAGINTLVMRTAATVNLANADQTVGDTAGVTNFQNVDASALTRK